MLEKKLEISNRAQTGQGATAMSNRFPIFFVEMSIHTMQIAHYVKLSRNARLAYQRGQCIIFKNFKHQSQYEL